MDFPRFADPGGFLGGEMGWAVPGRKEPVLESSRDARTGGGLHFNCLPPPPPPSYISFEFS